MFGLKSTLIVSAVLLALLAVVVWRNEVVTKKLNAARVELAQANATIEVERAALAHERKIAKEASDGFQRTVSSLQDELAARPLKPVVIRVPVRPSVPATASTGAAPGSDAGAEGREHGEAEIDITAELTAYSLDCQRNTSQLEALQGWVRARDSSSTTR